MPDINIEIRELTSVYTDLLVARLIQADPLVAVNQARIYETLVNWGISVAVK